MEEHKRPVFLSILSLLHVAGGILLAIVTGFIVSQFGKTPEVQQVLNMLGLPPVLFLVSIVFLFSLAIASGIGMWKGSKWGWYLGSFYYVYSMIRNIHALISIPALISNIPPEELSAMSRGPTYYYLKHGGRIVVSLLIYLYFFKDNVREFFSLSEQEKWKPLLAEVGTCIAVTAIVRVVKSAMNG